MDFRKDILNRLAKLGKTKGWLATEVGGDPGRNTVYTFLRGDGDITSRHLATLLEAIEREEKRQTQK